MKRLIILAGVFFLTTTGASFSENIDKSAEFLAAKAEVETNCYECYSRSPKALELAVQQLESLYDDGLRTTDLLKTLARAYDSQMAIDLDKDTSAYEQALVRRKDLLDQILVQCQDPDIAMKQITYLEGQERLDRLSEVMRLRETVFRAYYTYGMTIIAEQRNIEDGLEALRVAIRMASDADVLTYGARMREPFILLGHENDAAAVLHQERWASLRSK